MAQQPGTELRATPRRVLLDAGSTPMLPSARATLMAALDSGWADPRRLHAEGRRARAQLDQARELLAYGLGVRPPEVSFLPGGPAALRAGLEGLRYAGRRRGARMVATAVEHSAILTTGRYHAAQADNALLFAEVGVDRVGRVDLPALEDAISVPGTVLAAVQSANGEIGTRQPLERAHELCRAHDIPLLVDAMASLGRDSTPVHFDVLAGDARSWGGPAGLGVLVVPERTRWRRPGPASEVEHGRTDVEPVVAIALAAAEAWRQTQANRVVEAARSAALIQRLRAAAADLRDVDVVGDPDDRLPHVLTFSVLYVDGEALVTELDRRGFAVGSGSACTSSTLEPSHVLVAMGVLTHGNVRITLPLNAIAPTIDEDVDRFIAELPDAVAVVRAQLGGVRPMNEIEVDARGLRCPLPVIRLAAAARDAPDGTRITVLTSDPAARHDIPAWCRMRDHELIEIAQVFDPTYLRIVVVVRSQTSNASGGGSGSARSSTAM